MTLDEALDALLDVLADKIAQRLNGARPDDQLLPLADAATYAGTSRRVLAEALRHGELPAYGRQRHRVVRLDELKKWVASRRYRPTQGPADADIDRRVQRLEQGERPLSELLDAAVARGRAKRERHLLRASGKGR